MMRDDDDLGHPLPPVDDDVNVEKSEPPFKGY
jgi:hypothetical protein